jgi:hypothetical protein
MVAEAPRGVSREVRPRARDRPEEGAEAQRLNKIFGDIHPCRPGRPVFAGLILFWVMRADETERPKPASERLRRSPDESPTPDDATTALRKAVEAGEAAEVA